MPTPTDLVTDLPADFEVFGQAVDTDFADLLGGTTGQILSKASATDLDFTWITNDVGDITAVTVTAPITGGGTSGSVGIAISGATTSASGAVQLSDSTSTTSSVLASTPTATKAAYDLAASAYAPAFTNNYYAGKSTIINGNFDVWQRGTTFSSPANTAYTADRWNNGGSAGGTTTISQQTTGVPVGSQYCMRTAYGAASSYSSKAQILETSTSAKLWGKTVTASVKLRRNASFATTLKLSIQKSVTIDASTASTWVNIADLTVANASLPTGTTSADWYSLSVTAAIPNDGTANSIRILISEGAAGASGAYWEMAQAMLEIGSVVTPFQTASGSIGGELALCQRYYYRTSSTVAFGALASTAWAQSATLTEALVKLPVTMRVAPTTFDGGTVSNNAFVNYAGSGFTLTGGVTITTNQTTADTVKMLCGSTGMTAGQVGNWTGNASGYLGFGAEL